MEYKVSFPDKEKLFAAMAKFPVATKKNVNMALKIGARDIQTDARQNHRFVSRSGNAERSIETEYHPQILTAKVGIDKGVAKYGAILHDGTPAHVIKAKNGKTLRFVGKNGRFVYRKRIKHPGTKPDRFIHQASFRNTRRVNDLIHNAIEKSAGESFK